MFHPLRGFSKTCPWCTTLAVPANSQLSLREGCTGKPLQDIIFLHLLCPEKNYLTKQVTSPAVPLCSPAPSFLSHNSMPAPSCDPPSSPLSCLKSVLKSLFPSASFPCYSAPEPQLIMYPLLWPCWTQRARALGSAELCWKHKESLEAERVKFIPSNSNLPLVLRSKRSFFLTWITGIGNKVMPL